MKVEREMYGGVERTCLY